MAFEPKWTHHVIHLVGNVFQPTLYGLDASDHGSNLAADNSLGCQGLSKRLALTDPLQTFFHNPALSTGGGRGHHPAFMIEITGEMRGVRRTLYVHLIDHELYLSITKIPPPSGPSVFPTGTFTLSNVTYAVPAVGE